MTVQELTREQLEELKQDFLCRNNDNTSYYELAFVDDLVSDEEIFEYYSGTEFDEDDFFCSAA